MKSELNNQREHISDMLPLKSRIIGDFHVYSI